MAVVSAMPSATAEELGPTSSPGSCCLLWTALCLPFSTLKGPRCLWLATQLMHLRPLRPSQETFSGPSPVSPCPFKNGNLTSQPVQMHEVVVPSADLTPLGLVQLQEAFVGQIHSHVKALWTGIPAQHHLMS